MSTKVKQDPISYRLRNRAICNQSTDYWKLPGPYLGNVAGYADGSGCAYTMDHFHDLARHHFNRRYLRLFAYEDCSIEELKRFCRQRNRETVCPVRETMMATEYDEVSDAMIITPISVERYEAYKADYVALLNTSDDTAAFFGFTELPAELRVRIYSYLFESYPSLECPVQPPVARTSRLLRTESLPVFYQTCRFDLPNQTTYCYPDEICQLTHASHLYFANLDAHLLGRIRRLQWNCHRQQVLLDIAARRRRDQVRSYLPSWQRSEDNKRAERGLRKIVRDIARRPGENKLELGDIHAMMIASKSPSPPTHALADFQMQLMLLEQQNKRRLLTARQDLT